MRWGHTKTGRSTTVLRIIYCMMANISSDPDVENFFGGRNIFAQSQSPTGVRNLKLVQAQWDVLKGIFLQGVPEIGVEELSTIIDDNTRKLVLVDCREKDEQAISMIPNAITQLEFEGSVLPKLKLSPTSTTTTVVAYCTIGYRSGLYIEQIRKKYPEVATLEGNAFKFLNLRGSLLAWCHSGRPLINREYETPTTTIHTYGETWALPPDGYDATFYSQWLVPRLLGKVFSWWVRISKRSSPGE